MQVYTKYYGGMGSDYEPFVKYIPFTKKSTLSYEIGEFKNDIIKIHIEGVKFAVIQSKHAERFVNYFLEMAHNTLSIHGGTFVVYDGQELVDKYYMETT